MDDKTEDIEEYKRLLCEICKQMTCSIAEMDAAIQKLAQAFKGFTQRMEASLRHLAEILASDKGLSIRNIISVGYSPQCVLQAYIELINHYSQTFEIGDDMIIGLVDSCRLKKRQKSASHPIERHNNVKYKTTKGFARKPVWNRTRSNPKLR